MAQARVDVAVGSRLAHDGRWWTVTELTAGSVLLTDVGGGVRQIGLAHLLAHPSTRLLTDVPVDAVAGVGADLAGLNSAGREALAERVGHVQEVRTGFRRGCAELALPGEPRAAYAPGTAKLARYQAKAAELGIGMRTLRRWVAEFEADGPAGLVDERWRRRRTALSGVDGRWVDTARGVLAEFTRASTPTQDLVLAAIEARLEQEHGPGVVRLPGRTRARALLRELSRGTSAFGGAKARREIAGRPAAPYGKLRAHRPGEYLLVDTTRLWNG